MSKFDSIRDEALYQLSMDGWANEGTGDVESPQGAFSRIVIETPELGEVVGALDDEIRDRFPAQIEGFWNFDGRDYQSLIGNFLLVINSQGLVYVTEYSDQAILNHEYAMREAAFSVWSDQDENNL